MDTIRETMGSITAYTGNSHNFLGINLTFQEDGICSIKMDQYIQGCIDAFPNEVGKSCSTPAQTNLFIIDEASPPLSSTRADIFRSVTMKSMYLAPRCNLICKQLSFSSVRAWISPPSRTGKNCAVSSRRF